MLEKRHIIVSFMSFAVAFILVVSVLFAWFIQYSAIDNIPINVEEELINFYEIHFFKHDSTYRYIPSYGKIEMYNGSTWVDANYNGTEESGKDFNGIFMEQYDPLISINNNNNNIIIELRLNYSLSQQAAAKVYAMVNRSLATEAKLAFNQYPVHYISKYSIIQFMNITNYDRISANLFSIYQSATSMFIGKTNHKFDYTTDNPPMISLSTINFAGLSEDIESKDIYIYLNIAYDNSRIKQDLFPNIDTNPEIKPTYLFFQDINFIINKTEVQV